MGAYIGAGEGFGPGDRDPNQHRLEQVISYSPALESAYREIAELKDKLAQEKLSGGNRGSQRLHGVASRGNRHRQGIDCTGDP